MMTEPLRESFGTHLTPPAVEKNFDHRGAALLSIQPLEQRWFGAKELGLAARECGTTVKVHRGKTLKCIFRWRLWSDMSQEDLHEQHFIISSSLHEAASAEFDCKGSQNHVL